MRGRESVFARNAILDSRMTYAREFPGNFLCAFSSGVKRDGHRVQKGTLSTLWDNIESISRYVIRTL